MRHLMIEKINGHKNYPKKKFRNFLMVMNLKNLKKYHQKQKFQLNKNPQKPVNFLMIIENLILKCLVIQIVIHLMIHLEKSSKKSFRNLINLLNKYKQECLSVLIQLQV